jgi:hypothetical protein
MAPLTAGPMLAAAPDSRPDAGRRADAGRPMMVCG